MLPNGIQRPVEVFQWATIFDGHAANGGFTDESRQGFVPQKMVFPKHPAWIK